MIELSGFTALRRLGSGNRGLYEAERKADQRPVVLRLLPEALVQNQELWQRFQEQLGSLPVHSSICSVLQTAVEGDRPFMVMERLRGTTLKERLAKGPFRAPETEQYLVEQSKQRVRRPPAAPNETAFASPRVASPYETSEHTGADPTQIAAYLKTPRGQVGLFDAVAICDIAIDILNGLAALHQKGRVHGGLNPANVFLCEEGNAKLISLEEDILRLFLQPIVNPDNPAAVSLGSVKGTLKPDLDVGSVAYYSPEQAMGRSLDGRSDIFSMGSMLYEMLSGSRAFPEPSVQVLHSIARRENLIPATLAAIETPKWYLTTSLQRIIVKALERDRGMRYRTAAEMRSEVESLRTNTQRSLEAIERERKMGQARDIGHVYTDAELHIKMLGITLRQGPPEKKGLERYAHPWFVGFGVLLMAALVVIFFLLITIWRAQ